MLVSVIPNQTDATLKKEVTNRNPWMALLEMTDLDKQQKASKTS
jgi:hypothetical protein